MEQVMRAPKRRGKQTLRCGVAALALCGGLAGGPAPLVAWADSLSADTTSESKPAGESDPDASSTSGPSPAGAETDQTDAPAPDVDDDVDQEVDATDDQPPSDPDSDEDGDQQSATDGAVIDEPEPVHSDVDPSTPKNSDRTSDSTRKPSSAELEPTKRDTPAESATRTDATSRRAQKESVAVPALATIPTPALPAVAPPAGRPAAGTLSPVAELLELPGRVINAVLQALDITSSANSPVSPIDWGPVNDVVFGVFREVERMLGLHRTPFPQPVVPTLTYTGPTTRPTPTVGEFLNASTAGYVLGATPGGLRPFTVDGFHMVSTNVLTGMAGKAWITSENQVIIAYQGTTGGTNLLVNPLIAVSQVLADLQMVFTPTTPAGFYDAVEFAEQVQGEAARQGFGADDIFVTGHSLGGWQAQFVAQQTGLAGIGFEAPGMNSTVPGNGADSLFVNIGTYGSVAPYLSTDLPGLQPFMPAYVPGGGTKPHYGSIVMVGDPAAMAPLYNASQLWGTSLIGSLVFLLDALGNFAQYHMPGVQAYHLDTEVDPGVTPWLGSARGPVLVGYGALTIPQLLAEASGDGHLYRP